MSAVTTRSPGSTNCAILLSATSKPAGTCRARIYFDGGQYNSLFATSVNWICSRSAARNRISFMTFGHASASTQICITSPAATTSTSPEAIEKIRRHRDPQQDQRPQLAARDIVGRQQLGPRMPGDIVEEQELERNRQHHPEQPGRPRLPRRSERPAPLVQVDHRPQQDDAAQAGKLV